jgi:hypothetical protein
VHDGFIIWKWFEFTSLRLYKKSKITVLMDIFFAYFCMFVSQHIRVFPYFKIFKILYLKLMFDIFCWFFFFLGKKSFNTWFCNILNIYLFILFGKMNEMSQLLNQLSIPPILKNACSSMFYLCLSLCAKVRYFQVL